MQCIQEQLHIYKWYKISRKPQNRSYKNSNKFLETFSATFLQRINRLKIKEQISSKLSHGVLYLILSQMIFRIAFSLSEPGSPISWLLMKVKASPSKKLGNDWITRIARFEIGIILIPQCFQSTYSKEVARGKVEIPRNRKKLL